MKNLVKLSAALSWWLSVGAAVFPILVSVHVTALEDPINPAQPRYTITIKGNSGSIKADRHWNDGDKICWESRGVESCTLRKWVSFPIRDTGLSDVAGDSDPAGPRVTSASLRSMGYGLHLQGEVQNPPDRYWRRVKILVRFYDSQNKFRGQDELQVLPEPLLPNQVGTFDHPIPSEKEQLYSASERGGVLKRQYIVQGIP
jgi:hypothetical protein